MEQGLDQGQFTATSFPVVSCLRARARYPNYVCSLSFANSKASAEGYHTAELPCIAHLFAILGNLSSCSGQLAVFGAVLFFFAQLSHAWVGLHTLSGQTNDYTR